MRAAIIGVTTAGVFVPAAMAPGQSAYFSSKIAMGKMLEFVAHEHPHIFAATVHPGCVDTPMYEKCGRPPLPMDTGKLLDVSKCAHCLLDKVAILICRVVQLAAHFMLWMTSSEASFLNGRSVWANWDVGELVNKADEISKENLLTSGIIGWPFT